MALYHTVYGSRITNLRWDCCCWSRYRFQRTTHLSQAKEKEHAERRCVVPAFFLGPRDLNILTGKEPQTDGRVDGRMDGSGNGSALQRSPNTVFVKGLTMTPTMSLISFSIGLVAVLGTTATAFTVSAPLSRVSPSSTFALSSVSSNDCGTESNDDASLSVPSSSSRNPTRRTFLTKTSLVCGAGAIGSVAGIGFPVPAALAAQDDEFQIFEDTGCGISFSVPSSWEKAEQVLDDRRRIVLFVKPGSTGPADQTLVFVAFTPVRDDFTSLGSFGTVDQVRTNGWPVPYTTIDRFHMLMPRNPNCGYLLPMPFQFSTFWS